MQSWADCITGTREFSFWKRQWWPDAQEEENEVEEEEETGAETRSARSAAGANERLSLL